MKRMKSAAGVALALTLALAGVLINAPGAAAVPTLKINAGARGSDYIFPTVIEVDGCDDRSYYSGITYTLMDKSGAVVDRGAIGNDKLVSDDGVFQGRRIQLTPPAGFYTIEVKCLIYDTPNLPPVLNVRGTFVVGTELLVPRAGDPNKGGKVTFWNIGRFKEGEQVKLELFDVSAELNKTGKPVLLKTWATTAVVGAHTEWTYTVTLPTINPRRAYELRATGLTSKETAFDNFGDWENPDKNGLPGTGD